MTFDDLAKEAGQMAARTGTRAVRPPIDDLTVIRRRTNTLRAAAVLATVVLIAAIGLPWLLSDDRTDPVGPPHDRDSCPVTLPGAEPFTPESAEPEGPPDSYQSVWFGTPDLWTRVGFDGEVWDGLPVADDGTLTQKTFWWRDGFEMSEEGMPDITVRVELASGGDPIEFGNPGTSGSNPEIGQFMLVGISIPEEGCWKIEAEYRGNTLSYVAWASASSR